MERFALKVDLSAILKEVHHQKVMILVDPQWQTVAEVEKKLKKMFNIELSIGFNSSEGFFIPLEEPVEILKYVNMLIAFEVGQLNEPTKNRSVEICGPRSLIEPEILTTAEFASKKKRKYGFFDGEDFTTSTPNVAKHLKNVSPIQDTLSPDTETLKSPEKPKKKKTKTMSSDKVLQESNKITPKNRSKEKKQSIKVPNDKKLESKSESHIFFETNVEVDPTKANSLLQRNDEGLKRSKVEVVFLCELTDSELTGRGRSFQIGQHAAQTEDDYNNIKKQVNLEKEESKVVILENFTLAKPINGNLSGYETNSTIDSLGNSSTPCLKQSTKLTESSIYCDESAVIEVNESDRSVSHKESNFAPQETECSMPQFSESSRPSFLDSSERSLQAVPLLDLPNLNDRIIFKIMLLNDKISDNFIGICQYVNKRTKSIKIHLIDGHSQTRFLPQKYAGNIDDSNGAAILNVKLQEMIDPQVMQS